MNDEPVSSGFMEARILAIVPCYNEEGNIADTIQKLRNDNPKIGIVVVNDGSIDSSAEILTAMEGIDLLELPVNLGIGGAIQTGFRYFLRSEYETVVQFDGDGQHPSGQVANLVQSLYEKDCDLVVGSRFVEETDGFRSTFLRRIGIRILSWVVFLLCGQRIRDVTSGFRAYKRRTVEVIFDEYPDDYPEPVSTIMIHRKGLKICEIPVRMLERNAGRSSISGVKSIYYMLKVVMSMLVAKWGKVR
jgi:glycosyltransferase involved in cell wall biosynthesis